MSVRPCAYVKVRRACDGVFMTWHTFWTEVSTQGGLCDVGHADSQESGLCSCQCTLHLVYYNLNCTAEYLGV